MKSIEGSGVRRMFDLIATMDRPINLSIGQAHYDAPEEVKAAAIRAIREGYNRYTVTEGMASLCAATLDRLEEDRGYRPEAILMTAGVSGGLLLSSMALLDPGDKVLLPDPYFVMYKNVLALAGAEAEYYDLYPAGPGRPWRPDLDQLRALIGPRTKAVLINSPGNPTGGVWPAEMLGELVALCREHGVWILSDEIYEHFVYDAPFASIVPEMRGYDRVLALGGFSKTYGIPGWRLGWAVGPEAVLEAMKILQQYTFVCAPSPLQHGALAALDVDMGARRDEYRAKRDLVHDRLAGRFDLVPSEGSFYAFPAYPRGWTEQEFVQACLEERVLVVPGSSFSRRDTHFRLSFAAEDDVLDAGLSVLCEIADRRR
ncbi:MAG: pyridoxal phosphate-dependent aminotransferase [Planctomycetota bacterium]